MHGCLDPQHYYSTLFLALFAQQFVMPTVARRKPRSYHIVDFQQQIDERESPRPLATVAKGC